MPRLSRCGKGKGGPKKPSLTHFLCVPLVTPVSRPLLESSITTFRNDVCRLSEALVSKDDTNPTSKTELSDSTDTSIRPAAIAEKAIRPIGALHLTLGVMSLDRDKLQQAIQKLQEFDMKQLLSWSSKPPQAQAPSTMNGDVSALENKEVVAISKDAIAEENGAVTVPSTLSRPISPPPTSDQETPLKISVRSLKSMHAPHKTSILYALAEDSSARLEPLCNALRKQFMDLGFLIDDQRPLKLHATIVNTIYVKGRKRGSKPRDQSRKQPTDAEPVDANAGRPRPEDKKQDTETEEDGKAQESAAQPSQRASLRKDKPEQNDGSTGHGPNANAPLEMNAVEILERYKDYIWADSFILDRIAICEMGAKKILNGKGEVVSEEYTEVATIRLPE